ncbi:MAG: hypothetical protein H7095_03470 [Pseudopedobacter sp.]|nr:hypothetical protein [Deinococcales bacterium]
MTLKEKWHHKIEQMDDAQLESLQHLLEQQERIQDDVSLWKSFFAEFSASEAVEFARATERSSWRDLDESA